MIEVLVCDDHAVVRKGIRRILSESGDITVTGEAATADEVLGLVRVRRSTVVLLDISIPGATGIELIRQIRDERPDMRVLILTMHPEEQYAVRALRAGASGFLTKESAPDRLIEAVRRVATGAKYVTPQIAEALASALSGGIERAPHERLTDREFEVLRHIASGRTVSQIASDLSLSVKTVSTHRTRMLKKMSMSTNAELTRYAIRAGLVG